jgi:hypothetical protein
MSYPFPYSGVCAQCRCNCDPNGRLCDECQEIEDDALQDRCSCGAPVSPDAYVCDVYAEIAADEERVEREEEERARPSCSN